MPRQSGYIDQRGVTVRNKILAALAVKPMTVNQLCAHLYRSKSTVCKHLAMLKAAPRQIRVCGYLPPDGQYKWSELFGLGSAPDKPFHGRETRQQRWKKEKANTEYIDRYNASRRVDAAIVRLTKRPQNPFSALGL